MSSRPSYLRVFLTFVRNSLVRDMMFPTNFIIETISSFGWVMMNVGFYLLIFKYTSQIGPGTSAGEAWDKYQFFVFIATSMFINSIVQMFFMTNADEFSELIRTGGLDFALLKPIDTQFLISLRKIEWSSFSNFLVAAALMIYALPRVEGFQLTIWQVLLYPIYVLAGVIILYSLMIVLAAVSVWLGAIPRSTTSGFTLRRFRDTRWKSITGQSAICFASVSPLCCPCSSWSTCRPECWRSRYGPSMLLWRCSQSRRLSAALWRAAGSFSGHF